MKRILFVSNMYPSEEKPYAGIYVKNLYESLGRDEKQGRFDILTMERRFTGKLGSLVKYLRFFIRSISYLFRHYDVVHLHFLYPLIVWVYLYKLLHPRTKILVTCHGSDINQHFNGGFSRFVFGFMAKRFNAVVTVGNELASTVKYKLGRDVQHVIPAGIDETVFYREEHTADLYDLIFVGSFLALKGIPELVAALQGVDQRLRICFVGSGPLEPLIRQLEASHDIEIQHDLKQDQLRTLYNQSRFLVLPSHTEAFGLVVSEAMFCGTPVIAARTGGIQDQLEERVNGFYINEVSALAIADTLKLALGVMGDNYEQLAERALLSNRQFCLTAISEQYKVIYSDLINDVYETA